MTHTPIFRPPSEADSLILQVTYGCSHNRCTFCGMYKNTMFRLRPLEDILAEIQEISGKFPQTRRIFLADGDALILPLDRLLIILQALHSSFPKLARVSSYATPKSLLLKTKEELQLLHRHGLSLLYVGIESGDPAVLERIQKGASPQMILDGCSRAMSAGMKLSVTIIIGLGGKEHSSEHIRHTADLISAISPSYFNALTLMLFPGTPLYEEYEQQQFTPLTEREMLLELLLLLETLAPKRSMIFRANHPSNLIPLEGTLPKHKEKLLQQLKQLLPYADAYIKNTNNTGPY